MKQIVLCPVVIVTIDDEEKISIDMNFYSSISEAMDDNGEFRDVTDDERIFIDDKVLPFIQTSIDLSDNNINHEDLLKEIASIINLPGEDHVDGECLDKIAELLTVHGFWCE